MNYCISVYLSCNSGKYRYRLLRIWRYTNLNQTSYQNAIDVPCMKDWMILYIMMIIGTYRTSCRHIIDYNNYTDDICRSSRAVDVTTSFAYSSKHYRHGIPFTQELVKQNTHNQKSHFRSAHRNADLFSALRIHFIHAIDRSQNRKLPAMRIGYGDFCFMNCASTLRGMTRIILH